MVCSRINSIRTLIARSLHLPIIRTYATNCKISKRITKSRTGTHHDISFRFSKICTYSWGADDDDNNDVNELGPLGSICGLILVVR